MATHPKRVNHASKRHFNVLRKASNKTNRSILTEHFNVIRLNVITKLLLSEAS